MVVNPSAVVGMPSDVSDECTSKTTSAEGVSFSFTVSTEVPPASVVVELSAENVTRSVKLPVVITSPTATAAAILAERIRPLCQQRMWWLVGPAPAPVARVAGRSRWQLLLHGPAGSALPLPAGQQLWDALPRGVSLSVDPDPLEL